MPARTKGQGRQHRIRGAQQARGRQGNTGFYTKKGGYRITGGKCTESYTICDITKPFTGKACGATHTPTSDKGGTYSFRFEGGGGAWPPPPAPIP
jgi:hypothetical protein